MSNEQIYVTDWFETKGLESWANSTAIAYRIQYKAAERGVYQRHEFEYDFGRTELTQWIPGGAAMPDRIKPIETKETFYARIKNSDVPVEVTEEEYWEALEVLPPIYIKGTSWFAVSEAYSHTYVTGHAEPVYHCFAKIGGKYWGTLGTLPAAKEAFDKISKAGGERNGCHFVLCPDCNGTQIHANGSHTCPNCGNGGGKLIPECVTTRVIQAVSLGNDEWSRPTLKTVKTGQILVDINLGEGLPDWHTTTSDGEPLARIKKDIVFEIVAQIPETVEAL